MILCAFYMGLFGVALGLFAKRLDSVAVNVDEYVWWQSLIRTLDFGNVFSRIGIWTLLALAIAVYSGHPLQASLNVFLPFVGMLGGYYFYTIAFAGLFSKVLYDRLGHPCAVHTGLCVFCMVCEREGWLSVCLSALILGFFITQTFSIRFWYFDLVPRYWAELVWLILANVLLFQKRKAFFYILTGAIPAAWILQWILPYTFGGF